MTDFTVINMSRYVEECQICFEFRYLTHCVPFYEEPRPDLEIGGEIGGMSCCKKCHDEIYGNHYARLREREDG